MTREEFEQNAQQRRNELSESCNELLADKNNITLEIGCGHGHYLTAYAQENPNEYCIGIDLITKRIKKSENKQQKRELNNLAFMKAEAMEFLYALPENIKLQKTFLLFPDPWPKKRHHKNRLLQNPFLDRLAGLTPEGGWFYYRTDHEDYFDWALDFVAAHPNWEIVEDVDWPYEAPSFFQNLMESWNSIIAKKVTPQED